ncbi:glutamate synthase subunit alpha, partial [Brucella sp. 21LCYQ03]|nr:glutamate synthase subunit alpha [Brucella sp. 21LCYQ03]
DACGVGFVAHIKGLKSHNQVADALTMLENMEHRGACGCDPESGDGAGIMIQLPHEFLWEECISLGIQLQEPGYYGAGMVFLPKEQKLNALCRSLIEEATKERGMEFLGFRDVPVNRDGIGPTALSAEPEIVQFFVSRPEGIKNTEDFERKLYVLRRLIVQKVKEHQ